MTPPTKYLITAALPYANGAIHFGHLAGAYLPADCFARFQRLMGSDVCFICGSDEYGVAIAMSAELAGRSPKEHVDIFHEKNKELFSRMNLSFDFYSRTTNPLHTQTTQEFFLVLKKNGLVEKMEAEQLYSEETKTFYADRYVVGGCPRCGFDKARGDECTSCGASFEAIDLKNPRTKIGNYPLIRKKTEHWYLMLDREKEKLLSWIETRDWKPNVINFIKQYVTELRPRAITRDMKWGIPVPGEPEGKVFYVWFDAPIGYISATKEWATSKGDEDLWKKYWLEKSTCLVQFIGKDNIPFHAVIFPSMLIGQDLPYKLVDDLPANEFYALAGRQFSKSDHWYIDLETFLNTYTSDQLRYTILSNAPETQDSDFTWKDFQSRCNGDLLGKFGNYIHRTLVFAHQFCEGKVPQVHDKTKEDLDFLTSLETLSEELSACYSQYRTRRACQCLMEICQLANTYFDQNKPWALAKSGMKERCETCISLALQAVLRLAIVSEPILPDSSKAVFNFLNLDLSSLTWKERLSFQLKPRHVLKTSAPLFKKVEDAEIALEEEKLNNLGKASL